MKKIIFILSVLILISTINAITIPGATYNRNTTWSLANSPYIVTGNVTVNTGAILTIQPGVVIKSRSTVLFTINGSLIANGTQSAMITFTSEGVSDAWKGIVINNSSNSLFNYCSISKSKNYGAIYAINGTNISITNCDFFSNGIFDDSNPINSASCLYLCDINNINLTANKFHDNNTLYNGNYRGSTVYINKTSLIGYGESIIEENLFANNYAQIGGGINIENTSLNLCNPTYVKNNTFESNTTLHAGAIYASGCNNIISGNVIKNNNTTANGGGIYFSPALNNSGYSGINKIIDNKIFSNSAREGGGIYVSGACNGFIMEITDNQIYYNYASLSAGGAYFNSLKDTESDYSIFKNNEVFFNSSPKAAGLYFIFCKLVVNKCTITENESTDEAPGVLLQDNYSSFNLTNCILWNNKLNGVYSNQISSSGNNIPSISYSCIQNGINGVTNVNYGLANISSNPKFLDKYTYDFGLETGSPCISSGINNTYMGAVPYNSVNPIASKTSSLHSGWNWVAFPKLYDRDPETNANVAINNLLSGLTGSNNQVYSNSLQNYGIQILDHASNFSQYSNNTWSTQYLQNINSTKGYKLQMQTMATNYNFRVYGKTINPETSISLIPVIENWICYFLPESMTPEEAFGPMMDNLLSIKTENWSMSRTNLSSAWWSGTANNTLNYGDMVAVKTGLSSVTTMQWNAYGVEVPAFREEQAQMFSFTTQEDYTPIYVSLDIETPPLEIAVLANGEVRGASVYEGEVTQINAYFTPEDADAEISFSFANDSKSSQQKIYDYKVLNKYNCFESNKPISYQKGTEFYAVKIGTDNKEQVVPVFTQLKNYPNPFNPETRIEFYTSKEADVKLVIYNIKGQKVKELFRGKLNEGIHQMSWNGKDDNGKRVGTGIYLYTISTDKEKISKKMTLMK